jgi:hypothetical protein
MWTNEDPTWNLIRILKDKRMMTLKIWESLKQRASSAKFYYFTDPYYPDFQNKVYTAQYVRNWMWIYEQFKIKKSNPDYSNPTASYMNMKYKVLMDDVEHPEECKWVEVTGLNLDDMDSFSSRYDSFFYQGDTKLQVIREFPLVTFTSQVAELL